MSCGRTLRRACPGLVEDSGSARSSHGHELMKAVLATIGAVIYAEELTVPPAAPRMSR
jgi:hypothetical protein